MKLGEESAVVAVGVFVGATAQVNLFLGGKGGGADGEKEEKRAS